MREAWRLQKNELAERLASRQMQLDVFIIYTGSEIPDYKMVFEKTGDILKNLIKITNENGPPGT